MRSGTNPDPNDFREWVRDISRRMAMVEARPRPTAALDLLGPGIDSTARLVSNWNDDTVFFNGTYYSEVGSQNSPNSTLRWIGICMVDAEGSGYQLLVAYPGPETSAATVAAWATVNRKQRVFNTPPNGTRVYSAWLNA